MQKILDTSNQPLEQILSAQVRDWYSYTFEQSPKEIVCQICNNQVVITLENSITPIEKLLLNSDKQDLAEQVRFHMNQFLQEFLKSKLTEVMELPVQDCFIQSNLETGQTLGMIILNGTV